MKPGEEVVFLPTHTSSNPCTGKVFTVEMHHQETGELLGAITLVTSFGVCGCAGGGGQGTGEPSAGPLAVSQLKTISFSSFHAHITA